MEYKRYFWIKVILLPALGTGIDFTFSKQKVLLGSEGTLTMTCAITETDVDSVYLFQIRRLRETTLSGSEPTHWTTLALIEQGTTDTPSLDKGIIANIKDYVAGGSLDSNSPDGAVLTLSMNIQKLTCDDARYYICELTYKSSTKHSITSVNRNGTFTAYVKPQVTSLVTKIRNLIQESSEINPAAVNVGDQLKLRCTANIGSSPATFIRWHRTSETASSNEFICYQPPPGTFDDGTAVSDNQCGYYREETITYNATDFDANRENNLAFECYVTVSGDPYGASYTSENNPRFYTDVTDPGAETTPTSHQTSGECQASVIVGIVFASMTVGVFIGVVFTWLIIHRLKSVKGMQIQPNREESREISSVITSSSTQSPYESLEHGTGISHTYAGLHQSA